LLLFQLSDSEGGRGMQSGTTSNEATWLDGIRDTEPDQLCVPAPFSNLYGKRPSRFPPSHFFMSAQLAQSETVVKDSHRFIYLEILRWILVTGNSYVFSSPDQE
jgi:hypothetical protein